MKRFVLIIFALAWLLPPAHAQKTLFKGRVLDELRRPVPGVQVSVGNSEFATSDAKGNFEVMASKPGTATNTVNVEKVGYEKVGFQYLSDVEIEIVMRRLPMLFGKVLDSKGQPIKGTEVRVEAEGLQESEWTDENGLFRISLKEDKPIAKNANFFVNGELMPPATLVFADGYTVTIMMPKPQAGTGTPEEEMFFKATVYYQDGTAGKNLAVLLEGIEYLSDNQGEFIVNGSRGKPADIKVKGFEVESSSYDDTRHHLIIRVVPRETPLEEEEAPKVKMDSVMLEYKEDFNIVLRELEIRKQTLSENSLRIKTEMERIAERLNIDGVALTEEQRLELSADLLHLEQELIENELAYETAQEETKRIIDQMKYTLKAKDTQIEEIETELKQELAIFMVVVLVLGALAITSYLVASRIRKQKEELEKAYKNIQTISDIGKEITATLDFETLVQTVHASVDSLIDATIFGVGITNHAMNKIEFKSYIEQGETRSYFYESLDDDHKFSVWCLKHQQAVIVNDLQHEYTRYLKADKFAYEEDMPNSLVYLPLIIENKAIGVITVQSFRKNAYKAIDTTILQTLASYVSIALDNSNAYELIKDANKNITNSIRYAQTIQEAILPSPAVLDRYLSDHFIIYRPKDIVSGDFYWFSHVPSDMAGGRELLFLAAVDCTGHGVPGAFMSMIGNTLLDEIIEQKHIYDTDQVLEHLNDAVKEALKQESKVNDDGMDICLCRLERKGDRYELMFTGAKRPLYCYRRADGMVHTIKGDPKSIGGIQRKRRSFTKQVMTLEPGDSIYLTSDGMVDQCNTTKEKFGTQHFVSLLEEIALLHMPEQERAIEKALNVHQGDTDQRDDILIMGVQF
jgi:serine phosphatase RsbU (regulator of sigma subunit)